MKVKKRNHIGKLKYKQELRLLFCFEGTVSANGRSNYLYVNQKFKII